MNNKPKILLFIDWFTPAFKAGGPIKSVVNIVNSLHPFFDFYIVTSDRDINEKHPFENITFNTWIEKEHYAVIYLSSEKRDSWIKNHLQNTNYDVYYFNGLFSKNFTLKPLRILNKIYAHQKIIICPRGMLGKGALAIKPLKKKMFLMLAKTIGYYKNIVWHATNKEEKNDIATHFGKQSSIKVASNISLCKIEKTSIEKSKNNLKLVFFSRIASIKNLNYALQLMVKLPNVSLDIYGSIEDKPYWEKCKKTIKDNHLNATYKGEILPINVTKTLCNYHFLLLPTLHENYGHVITESLAAGCGLIISDKTPWRNLIAKKIGWDVDLDNQNQFINVIKQCVAMEQEEYNAVRNNCYNFVENHINTSQEIEATKNLFQTV